jgi:hypothetical protein
VTKGKVYSFRVDEVTQRAIDKLAMQRDITPSQLLRELVITSIGAGVAGIELNESERKTILLDHAIEIINLAKNAPPVSDGSI